MCAGNSKLNSNWLSYLIVISWRENFNCDILAIQRKKNIPKILKIPLLCFFFSQWHNYFINYFIHQDTRDVMHTWSEWRNLVGRNCPCLTLCARVWGALLKCTVDWNGSVFACALTCMCEKSSHDEEVDANQWKSRLGMFFKRGAHIFVFFPLAPWILGRFSLQSWLWTFWSISVVQWSGSWDAKGWDW